MADLIADSATMDASSQQIQDLSTQLGEVGNSAISAVGSALDAIAHPTLQAAVERAQSATSVAYQALTSGLSVLAHFAATSGETIVQTDQQLAADIKVTGAP